MTMSGLKELKSVGKSWKRGELMREITSPKKILIDFFSGINGLYMLK